MPLAPQCPYTTCWPPDTPTPPATPQCPWHPYTLASLKCPYTPTGSLMPPHPCQWECWDPGLGPNVVRLPVYLPPSMPSWHPLQPHVPNTPYTLCQPPDAPSFLPVGMLGPWTGAQCGQASSPPATPMPSTPLPAPCHPMMPLELESSFFLLSLCNWPSSWVHAVYNIPSVVVKSMSAVLWGSANFCNISKIMHSKAPVASQYWKTNKVVWTWKYDWPPSELLHTKDLLPRRVTV